MIVFVSSIGCLLAWGCCRKDHAPFQIRVYNIRRTCVATGDQALCNMFLKRQFHEMDILWSLVNISHNVSAFVCVQLFFEYFDISVLKCSSVRCYFLLRNFPFILKILFETLLITTFLSLNYFFPQVSSNFLSISAH